MAEKKKQKKKLNAKQGQRYRILPPARTSVAIGHGRSDRYVHRFTNKNGETMVLEDIFGDVIHASDNVDYPRGADSDYRNVKWINKHPERFQLIHK